jgi:hypothetical protein
MDTYDVLSQIFDFCGDEKFLKIAPVSMTWYKSYGKRSRYTKAITKYTTVENISKFFEQGLCKSPYLTEETARFSLYEELVYCIEQGCEISPHACDISAEMGNIGILQFLSGFPNVFDGKNIFKIASISNKIQVIKWAIDNKIEYSEDAVCSACLYGNLDILILLLSSGFLLKASKHRTPCGLAIQGNHTHVVKYLIEDALKNNTGCAFEAQSLAYASLNGNLEMVKLLISFGFKWIVPPTYFGADHYVISEAARGGHLELIKWMKQEGCPWGTSTFREASGFGNIEMMEWIRDNGCPFDESSIIYASSNGKLDAVKWLRSNGCPWDIRAVFASAYHGEMDTLGWLIDNGCPCIIDEQSHSYTSLVLRGKSNVLQWIIDRRNGLGEIPQDG